MTFMPTRSAHRSTIRQRAFRGADILYTLRLPDGCEIPALLPANQTIRLEPPSASGWPHSTPSSFRTNNKYEQNKQEQFLFYKAT